MQAPQRQKSTEAAGGHKRARSMRPESGHHFCPTILAPTVGANIFRQKWWPLYGRMLRARLCPPAASVDFWRCGACISAPTTSGVSVQMHIIFYSFVSGWIPGLLWPPGFALLSHWCVARVTSCPCWSGAVVAGHACISGCLHGEAWLQSSAEETCATRGICVASSAHAEQAFCQLPVLGPPFFGGHDVFCSARPQPRRVHQDTQRVLW